jgi:hypothetical protein
MSKLDLAIGAFTGEPIKSLPCFLFLDFIDYGVELKFLCDMKEEAYERMQKNLDIGFDPESYIELSDFYFNELEHMDKYPPRERGEFMAERSQYLDELNYLKFRDLKSLGERLNRRVISLIWR